MDIDIIHGAVGAIKESDVTLADTAKAIIIGFNVRPDANAKALAAQKHIDIRFYDIIYNAIEDIERRSRVSWSPSSARTCWAAPRSESCSRSRESASSRAAM